MTLRDQARVVAAQRQSELDALEATLKDLGEDHPARAELEAAVLEARAIRDVSNAAATRVDSALDEAANPTGPISHVVGAVAPWLPEPVRTPLVLGGALAASVLRGWQLRRGLVSVADGLTRAVESDPAFSEQFLRHAHEVRAAQNGIARKLVAARVETTLSGGSGAGGKPAKSAIGASEAARIATRANPAGASG